MPRILLINVVFSLFVFMSAARIYVLPRVNASSLQWIAPPILLLHAMRHLGLLFLAPGVTLPGLPPQFAYPAALGDLLSAVLAMIALFVLRASPTKAIPWLWLFSIVGTIDFISSITLANIFGAAPYLSAAYWIPSFWVPMLITGHVILWVQLFRLRSSSSAARSPEAISAHAR
ncbi:MAG: hypothetical protein EAZ43_16060 [Betaproteobacteria bacterium]|nr:MAG: hypothetical protein EAZ43_16060 [Betaproteobacteria bacterium]